MKNDSIKDQISKALNEEGLSDHLKRLNVDQHQRMVRKVKPTVLRLPADGLPIEIAPVPGSIMLFYAKKGDELLQELENAYTTNDVKSLNRIGKILQQTASERKVGTVKQAVNELIKSPIYFDFRYGGKTLAPNLGLVGGAEIAGISFAYNGGQVFEEDFSLIEYYNQGKREEYDVLVLVRPPKLTEIEAQVLEAVPPSLTELNIGTVAACPGTTVVLVLVITVITVAGQACSSFRDRLAEVVLPVEYVERYGKLASARELLNLRRSIFAEFEV